MAYRFYVSDTLRIMAKNGAKQSGGDYFDKRYCDIVSTPKANTRNAAEMVAEVISRTGIKVI